MTTNVSAPESVALQVTHYENFPVASFFCPAHLRAPIAAIYHFARTADDIADEGNTSALERLQDLHTYRECLESATSATYPASAPQPNPWPHVFIPLQHNLQKHRLPVQLLHDLLDAFVQDVEKTRDGAGYAHQAELDYYCRRSANPVGRLMLHLYEVADPQALLESDHICTALQLINFWQDPSVDIPRGRYYFPADACARFGVTQTDLLALRQTSSATQLIAECAYSARANMLKGSSLVHKVPGRAGWELRLVVQGGLRILDKIEALNFATLQTRPTLKWWDFPVMVWRALWM
jgi:squalene synthase HpnC